MKRLFLLLFICVPMLVMAQQHKSLEIDASSFAPIQTGALSGVAIDKIMPDYSKRPCARIKLYINRMSRDEIANLSVKTIGGNVVVMRKDVVSEGNGLIIELTAKEQTRFYLHHDKYGDSNEVTLNLEGDKEYRLNAQLSLLQSIVVSTNVAGADVYIDDAYKGKTNEGSVLTVNDVMHGIHKIRVEHGVAKSEKEVEVSSTHIHFRIEVNTTLSRPQYVVFEVFPKNASVVIDNKTQIPDQYGLVQVVLSNGTYSYSVSAKDYHTDNGTFVVKGEKVEQSIKLRPAHGWLKVLDTGALEGARVFVDGALIGTAPVTSDRLSSGAHNIQIVKNLYKNFEGKVVISDNETLEYAPKLVADFAHVTLNAGGDYDIYVNNEYKGDSPWSGDLGTGTYIFEARKDGHRTTSISQTIVAEPQKQNYTIPSPTPIMGALNITSTPAMATVLVDNKEIGRTPLIKDLIIGKHSVSIRKDGYENVNKSILIQEGKTDSLSVTLSEKKSYSSSSNYSSNSSRKYCKIKYISTNSPVYVYVDGEYKGIIDDGIWLSHGNHYIVVQHIDNYYGRTFYIGDYSNTTLDMVSAPKVNSIYKKETSPSSYNSSSSYSSTYSKPKSSYKKKKYYRSWDSFNLGVFADMALITYDESLFGLGFGLNWRLWSHNSMFIPMIGARYMYGFDNSHAFGFPMVVNGNWLGWFGATKMSCYFGVGIEPIFIKGYTDYYEGWGTEVRYGVSSWDCAIIINIIGCSWRHHDFNSYVNFGLKNDDNYSVGFRYTYFF